MHCQVDCSDNVNISILLYTSFFVHASVCYFHRSSFDYEHSLLLLQFSTSEVHKERTFPIVPAHSRSLKMCLGEQQTLLVFDQLSNLSLNDFVLLSEPYKIYLHFSIYTCHRYVISCVIYSSIQFTSYIRSI